MVSIKSTGFCAAASTFSFILFLFLCNTLIHANPIPFLISFYELNKILVSNALELANPDCVPWMTSNDIQRRYLDSYHSSMSSALSNKSNTSDSSGILDQYLKGKVTNDCNELNQFFADNGFPDMKITYPPNGLGIGSIFDLLVDWMNPGVATSLYVEEQRYKGVQMKSNPSAIIGYKLESYEFPMFELATRQDGWKVYLVEADVDTMYPLDSIDLLSHSQHLLSLNRENFRFTKLKFPEVSMELNIDISWMKGMRVKDGFQIDETMKKIILRLDDKGARAKSAVALTTRGLDMGIYTIQKPFFVIFMKEGLALSPFVAVSGQDTWIKK